MGHFEELEKYFRYIENILYKETDRVQPLYSIIGEKKILEIELPLEGYLGINKPVRVGNDAYTHIQNDVYGQVLASMLPLYIDKRLSHLNDINLDLIYKLVHLISKTIDEPDAGLWEFRNKSQMHCYTFLFQWVGAKAASKIAIHFKDPDLLQLAKQLEEKAAAKIEKFIESNVPEIVFGFTVAGQTDQGILSSVGFKENKNLATIVYHMVPPDQRKRSSQQIAKLVEKELKKMPEVEQFNVTGGSILCGA